MHTELRWVMAEAERDDLRHAGRASTADVRQAHAPGGTRAAHFRKEFPGLKGKRPFLKNGVYDLVEQATQKTPADRMPLTEMAERLTTLAEGKDTGGTGTAPKSRRRRRRRY